MSDSCSLAFALLPELYIDTVSKPDWLSAIHKSNWLAAVENELLDL